MAETWKMSRGTYALEQVKIQQQLGIDKESEGPAEGAGISPTRTKHPRQGDQPKGLNPRVMEKIGVVLETKGEG